MVRIYDFNFHWKYGTMWYQENVKAVLDDADISFYSTRGTIFADCNMETLKSLKTHFVCEDGTRHSLDLTNSDWCSCEEKEVLYVNIFSFNNDSSYYRVYHSYRDAEADSMTNIVADDSITYEWYSKDTIILGFKAIADAVNSIVNELPKFMVSKLNVRQAQVNDRYYQELAQRMIDASLKEV